MLKKVEYEFWTKIPSSEFFIQFTLNQNLSLTVHCNKSEQILFPNEISLLEILPESWTEFNDWICNCPFNSFEHSPECERLKKEDYQSFLYILLNVTLENAFRQIR